MKGFIARHFDTKKKKCEKSFAIMPGWILECPASETA